MNRFEQIRSVTANLVANYDEHISAVGDVIRGSLRLVDEQRESELVAQRELRDRLAAVGSLRRKDFDSLMAPVLAHQEQKDREIRNFLRRFLESQHHLASQLRRSIEAGVLSDLPSLEDKIRETIFEAQRYINDFQNEQALIGDKIQCLLNQKQTLTTKDLKQTLKTLTDQLGMNPPKAGRSKDNEVGFREEPAH